MPTHGGAPCARSTDPTLAAIAAKAEKEVAYHLRHSAEWLIRLGDGTEESHRRAAGRARRCSGPTTGEMFEPEPTSTPLIAAGVDARPGHHPPNLGRDAGRCPRPKPPSTPADAWMQTGGRTGRHTEHLGFLLAEMQHLQRAHPGAQW